MNIEIVMSKDLEIKTYLTSNDVEVLKNHRIVRIDKSSLRKNIDSYKQAKFNLLEFELKNCLDKQCDLIDSLKDIENQIQLVKKLLKRGGSK